MDTLYKEGQFNLEIGEAQKIIDALTNEQWKELYESNEFILGNLSLEKPTGSNLIKEVAPKVILINEFLKYMTIKADSE